MLTNIAGVTRWFSADPEAAGAAPRTYARVLTDGTPGTLDHEDAHSVTTEAPSLTFLKTVENVTTGQNPGSNAAPGDTLRYTVAVSNSGPVGIASISITDEVDRLNATPVFAPGSLNLVSVPAGADTTGTSAVGGVHGTGRVNVANLSIGAQGDPDNTVTVVFEITLAPVITSGTVVLNQAEFVSGSPDPLLLYSDDPNISGSTDPTETLIASAPLFQVQKISTDMTGDSAILMAGDTLRYTITIKNIGSEDAVNVRLRDYTPDNTTYVANSTTLNGSAVSDPSPGVNPLHNGILVNASENPTAGYLRADAAPGATNVATVTFDVVVDPAAMDGLIIANQGFAGGSGTGSGPQPVQPSDDPNTPIPDDPTRNVVGNLPLLYAQKTVQIYGDSGTAGIVDPGDVLRYTIVINNFGAIPATGVTLTDTVPADTTYEADSLRLNGASIGPDGGVLPLIAGLAVQSPDNAGAGIVSAGASAVITFEARVNAGVPTGTVISNQGSVNSSELPPELTDADGVPANGHQPTIIVVGDGPTADHYQRSERRGRRCRPGRRSIGVRDPGNQRRQPARHPCGGERRSESTPGQSGELRRRIRHPERLPGRRHLCKFHSDCGLCRPVWRSGAGPKHGAGLQRADRSEPGRRNHHYQYRHGPLERSGPGRLGQRIARCGRHAGQRHPERVLSGMTRTWTRS